MRGLDGRHYSLGPGKQRKSIHRLGVVDRLVASPPGERKIRVLRTNAWVVQASRDRMRLPGLPILVLEHISPHPVQHPDLPRGNGRGMPAGFHALASSLEAIERHTRIGKKVGE